MIDCAGKGTIFIWNGRSLEGTKCGFGRHLSGSFPLFAAAFRCHVVVLAGSIVWEVQRIVALRSVLLRRATAENGLLSHLKEAVDDAKVGSVGIVQDNIGAAGLLLFRHL